MTHNLEPETKNSFHDISITDFMLISKLVGIRYKCPIINIMLSWITIIKGGIVKPPS